MAHVHRRGVVTRVLPSAVGTVAAKAAPTSAIEPCGMFGRICGSGFSRDRIPGKGSRNCGSGFSRDRISGKGSKNCGSGFSRDRIPGKGSKNCGSGFSRDRIPGKGSKNCGSGFSRDSVSSILLHALAGSAGRRVWLQQPRQQHRQT